MRRYNLAPLASSLFIQAAITLFFTLGPLAGSQTTGGWRAAEVLLAGAAAAVGVFLRTGAPQSRSVVLAFEAVAVAIGAYGLMAEQVYLPGTIIGIGVLIRVASLPSSAPAPVVPAAPAGFPQYGEPCAPDAARFGVQQPQYGAAQPYGQPQYSAAQPFGQPQYAPPPQQPPAPSAPSPYESAAPTPPPAPDHP